MDSNGRIATFGPNQGFTDANTFPMVIGDFNGDGKTDVGRVYGAGVSFRISKGDGTWVTWPILQNFGSQNYPNAFTRPMAIGDFNGDGKTDVGRVFIKTEGQEIATLQRRWSGMDIPSGQSLIILACVSPM